VPKSVSESVDDYLKAIFELSGPAGEAATSNAIAQRLGVSAPSVTGMLQKLSTAKRPCITYQKHRGARLTNGGRKRALRIIHRHRLVELFLCQVLGYSWDEVHPEAERLEHFISEKLEERIAQKLGNPEFDPHGDIIPGKDGTLPERKTMAMADAPPGSSVVVSCVSDRDRLPNITHPRAGWAAISPWRRLISALQAERYTPELTLKADRARFPLGWEN
jgi:DtxR family transcriptional regulator, Mn-dependent transcriptional regulator